MPKQVSLIYGPSASGKTTLLGTFARGLWKATGKKSRLYTADGGDWLDRDLIECGAVEIWNLNRATFPFERLREIAQGAWPIDPTDPDSPVIPAILAVQYIAQCPQCDKVLHKAEKLPTTPPACPDCRRPVPLKMSRKINEANGIQNVGAMFYEGLTAFGESLMDNMSLRSARGEKMGEEVAVRFTDGAEPVAGSSRSSYGIGQRRPKAAVEETRLLPVDYVFWTARLSRGSDDERRVAVFGPKLPGSAATDEAPSWFGPTLALVSAPAKIGSERRLYLRSFYQTWNKAVADVENLANARIPAHRLSQPVKIGNETAATVPEYIVCDPKNAVMLWDVMQMIEECQGPAAAKPAPPVTQSPKSS